MKPRRRHQLKSEATAFFDGVDYRVLPASSLGDRFGLGKKERDELLEILDELEGEGIGTIGIMPNDTEAFPADGFENMKRFAEAHTIHFPYVIDKTQAVARAYDAICTPDFFGFNADLGLQYRGRLDESKQAPVAGARRELREAMIAIATTGKGPDGQIASMGCSIKWRAAA